MLAGLSGAGAPPSDPITITINPSSKQSLSFGDIVLALVVAGCAATLLVILTG